MWIFFVWMYCIVIYLEYYKNVNYLVMEQCVLYFFYLKFELLMWNLIKLLKFIWKKKLYNFYYFKQLILWCMFVCIKDVFCCCLNIF